MEVTPPATHYASFFGSLAFILCLMLNILGFGFAAVWSLQPSLIFDLKWEILFRSYWFSIPSFALYVACLWFGGGVTIINNYLLHKN